MTEYLAENNRPWQQKCKVPLMELLAADREQPDPEIRFDVQLIQQGLDLESERDADVLDRLVALAMGDLPDDAPTLTRLLEPLESDRNLEGNPVQVSKRLAAHAIDQVRDEYGIDSGPLILD